MFKISLTFLTFQVMTMSISDPKLTCKAQNHWCLDHRSESIRSVIRNMCPRSYFVEFGLKIRSVFFQKSEPQSSGPREKLLISTSCTVRRICKNCFSNVRYQQPIIFDTDSKRQTRFGYGRTFTKLQRYLWPGRFLKPFPMKIPTWFFFHFYNRITLDTIVFVSLVPRKSWNQFSEK